MAPRYQLYYFDTRGRAENTRLLFAQADVEYEDNRLGFGEDWAKFKPETPLGQMPVLRFYGVVISESNAITRFVAREHGLFGSTGLESGRIESLLDIIREVFDMGHKINFSSGENKAATSKSFLEKVPVIIRHLESVLQENKAAGWLVGNQVSVADITLYNTVAYFADHWRLSEFDQFKKSQRLMKNHEKVANLPRIKAWVEKRPKTDM